MATTLQVLRQNVAKSLGGYWSGMATDGTATTLIDTSHDSPFTGYEDAETFAQRWLLLTSGDNDGRIRRIRAYDPYTFKISWLNPTDLTAIAAGSTYEIYAQHPDALVRWINAGLERLRYETRGLLTTLSDGDMEASDTTAWTASNATLSKVTSGVQFGTRALRVLNSSANGHAGQSIAVVPGDTWSIAAGVTAAVGTAQLVLYDVTNGAVIRTLSGTPAAYRVLWDEFTIPTGCLSLSVRLGGVESTADTRWDTVQLLRTNGRRLPAPSWLTRKGQIHDLERVALTNASSGTNLYAVDEMRFHPAGPWDFFPDPTAADTGLIEYSGHFSAALLFVRATRPYAALSAGTETTAADPLWVEKAARAAMARELANTAASEDAARWAKEADKAALELTHLSARRAPRPRSGMIARLKGPW